MAAPKRQPEIVGRFQNAVNAFLDVAETAIADDTRYCEVAVAAKRIRRVVNGIGSKPASKEGGDAVAFRDAMPLILRGTERIEQLTGLLAAVDSCRRVPIRRLGDEAIGGLFLAKGPTFVLPILESLCVTNIAALDRAALARLLPLLGLGLPTWEDILRWIIKIILMTILVALWWGGYIDLDTYLELMMLLGALDEAADAKPDDTTTEPPGGDAPAADPPFVTMEGDLTFTRPDGTTITGIPGTLIITRLKHCQWFTVQVDVGELAEVVKTSEGPEVEVFEWVNGENRLVETLRQRGDSCTRLGKITLKLHAKDLNDRDRAVTIEIKKT